MNGIHGVSSSICPGKRVGGKVGAGGGTPPTGCLWGQPDVPEEATERSHLRPRSRGRFGVGRCGEPAWREVGGIGPTGTLTRRKTWKIDSKEPRTTPRM